MSWASRRTRQNLRRKGILPSPRVYGKLFPMNALEIIDAFCGNLGARELRGNPAAVVLLESQKSDFWLQNVAAEMNLAETAFLQRAKNRWNLRWFTPQTEVDLCGHATLGAAHFLISNRLCQSELEFETRSGILSARAVSGEIELNFPAQNAQNVMAQPDLLASLGGGRGVPVAAFRAGADWLFSFPSGQIEALKPDFARLKAMCQRLNARGVIVTEKAPLGADYDFVSRFFAPAIGIDEDSATGSAHAALGPLWAKLLGKNQLVGVQMSARGGLVNVRVEGERVVLSGRAQTRVRGHWLD